MSHIKLEFKDNGLNHHPWTKEINKLVHEQVKHEKHEDFCETVKWLKSHTTPHTFKNDRKKGTLYHGRINKKLD